MNWMLNPLANPSTVVDLDRGSGLEVTNTDPGEGK